MRVFFSADQFEEWPDDRVEIREYGLALRSEDDGRETIVPWERIHKVLRDIPVPGMTVVD